MQKNANLVELEKCCQTHIFLQNLASMQKKTSPIKFAHLAEKSERKVRHRTFQLREIPLLRAFPHDVALPALDEAVLSGSEMAKRDVRTRILRCECPTAKIVLVLYAPVHGDNCRNVAIFASCTSVYSKSIRAQNP